MPPPTPGVVLGGRADWEPPRGAEALLGVLAGGVLFGAIRRSELWGDLNTVRHPELVATVGVASCAAAAGLLALVTPSTERPGRAAVARAAVPAVAGVIVAVAMDRNRLSTSIQLRPGVFGDPFRAGGISSGAPALGWTPLRSGPPACSSPNSRCSWPDTWRAPSCWRGASRGEPVTRSGCQARRFGRGLERYEAIS
ncbi:MAG: hypothetical protein ACRDPC_29305 [Solirubrobacteraceae bacterium]